MMGSPRSGGRVHQACRTAAEVLGIYFSFNFVGVELDFISDHSETSRLIPQPSPPTQFPSRCARSRE